MSIPTVYATLKSKTGILRELMREAIFGPRHAKVVEVLAHSTDAVESIARTAEVARAIYEGESAELSLLMNASAFSPELRKLQLELERIRLDLQRDRIEQLSRWKTAIRKTWRLSLGWSAPAPTRTPHDQ